MFQADGSGLDDDGDGDLVVSESASDDGDAAQQKPASKRGRDSTSVSQHSSRDSSLARTTRAGKPVAETKVVEGRKRLRKAS